ncbi:hypothetical protein H0X06_06975 [Candidatus Dependentiae bacterium]|nr:hypothetical protein [Candidatus Dependentiae bacterium]
MTIFKTSLLLALVVGPCFGTTAEFSPKQKHLLNFTAQTAGCIISTAAAGYFALVHFNGIKKYGLKKYFYNKDTWHSIEHMVMWPGVPACFSYLGYRLGKDARNSYRKAFYPKKNSANTTIDENSIDATESSVVDDKNTQQTIVS